MKTLKDSKGASIGVHDTVIVNGIVNGRTVLSINLDDGTIEVVSVDGHVMTVSPDHCFITKKEGVDIAMPASHAPAMPEPVSRDVVLRHLGLRLSSWPTNIREAEGLFDCDGWLWTMINGLPTAYCPTKELHIHRDDWSVGRVAMRPSLQVSGIPPTTTLQPGERVEALDGEGVYEECITVGPHPHGTGEFVFITDSGVPFLSNEFRPVKTECERTVEAAMICMGYDPSEFSNDDLPVKNLAKLFKAGYLSEPK